MKLYYGSAEVKTRSGNLIRQIAKLAPVLPTLDPFLDYLFIAPFPPKIKDSFFSFSARVHAVEQAIKNTFMFCSFSEKDILHAFPRDCISF